MLFTQPLALTAAWSRVRDDQSVQVVDGGKYRAAVERNLKTHLTGDREIKWIHVNIEASDLPIALACSVQLEGEQLQGEFLHNPPIGAAFGAGKQSQHCF